MTDSESKTPIDQALDLFVYLPIGFLFELPRAVPRFIERGRRELHASDHGNHLSETAGRQIDRFQAHATSTMRAMGIITPSAERPGPRASAAAPAPAPAATTTMPAEPSPDFDATFAPATSPEIAAVAGTATPAATLAIPGYDSLSASQVVPRLEGLTVDELELVRLYENANRGRKTILNKVAQIQAR